MAKRPTDSAKEKKYVLVVRGPFAISCSQFGQGWAIESRDVSEFWSKPEVAALAQKHGAYIFAMRAAKGFRPWYVGQTKVGLKNEVFNGKNLNTYNKVIANGGKGTPVLFFIVAQRDTKKKLPARVVNELESELIQAGFFANDDLQNTAGKRRIPQWGIKGALRSPPGKPSSLEKAFKTLMGM